ncbi:hypothetical protein [Thermococcus sp. Bubb.Bath]|uniref:hypothetical protein n=1 Tax=Thermococcus sp. Bubb.Bath TaxID=1638242 RepID=UPI00197D6550|nr:hypothetical protein [Thermococcus sp. Bubb.Bath]
MKSFVRRALLCKVSSKVMVLLKSAVFRRRFPLEASSLILNSSFSGLVLYEFAL